MIEGSLQCIVPIRFLKKKIDGVDVQGLIDDGILSPDSHLKRDPIKNAEAVKTGETEKIREISSL